MVMGMSLTAFAEVIGDGTNSNPYMVENFEEGDQVPFENDIYIKCSGAGVYYYHVYNEDKTSLITNGAFGSTNTRLRPNNDPFGGLYDKLVYWKTEDGTKYCFYCISKQSPVPEPTSEDSSTHVHNFQWQTITEPTQYADGLEGEVCSCGATRNTSVISAMDYAVNKYADQMIKAAKPGQKITLEFGEFNSFPRYMMEKVAARMNENITFVFKFKQNKKMQTVTIEPGTAIDLQYDWYGPDKMKELYGAE